MSAAEIKSGRQDRLQCVEQIAAECVHCRICVQECSFLQEYGTPVELALAWQRGSEGENFPFECSLCGLCFAVCPKKLNPSGMFLEMRRELVASGGGIFRRHRTIRAYEKRGSSSLFSWFYLPPGCRTILFPGCAFPGSRPQTLLRLFRFLMQADARIGIVLDCCTKPSHDLGDTKHFQKMFSELLQIVTEHGVEKVLTVCPNCHRIFSEYGKGLQVESVYETLLTSMKTFPVMDTKMTIHDPCGVRFAEPVRESVRTLARNIGISVEEMPHSGKTSFCCGEGGSAGFLRPDLSRSWTEKRVAEAGASQVLSYCTGCIRFLGKSIRIEHILDLLFDPSGGDIKESNAPFTYLSRYLLRRRLQKTLPAGISGTRRRMLTNTGQEPSITT